MTRRCRFMVRTGIAARLCAVAGLLLAFWTLYMAGVK